MKHAKSLFALILTAALAAPVAAPAADGDPAHRLEQRLAELEEALGLAQAEKEESSGIRIGGAVRVQYSYTDWVTGNN
ncbi:hypothetical protein [Geoalkalibacter halelectricus]|uniref:hypothetical protein n=1 Tax=Geoalkalibacter halelectricus TaxID=2847045 RepID=UPI003D217B12